MTAKRWETEIRALAGRWTRRAVLAGGAGGLAAIWAGRRPTAAQDATPAACLSTTPDENRELARRYHEDAMSGHNLAALDELLAPAEAHNAATFPNNPGTRAIFAALLQAYPDIQVTVQLTVAEGDQVTTRWQATGTDTGGFLGAPPSGRPATWTGITIFTFKCGRIVNIVDRSDGLARMRQTGLLPELGPAIVATPDLASPAMPATPCPQGSIGDNRAVVERWFADTSDPHTLDRLSEIVAPDAVLHAASFHDTVGPEGMANLFRALFSGFSDLRLTTKPGPAEGDLVVTTWTARGTHDGTFQGVAATGRPVSWSGSGIFRISCGRVPEAWVEIDTLGRLRQIGAISDGGTPAAGTPVASMAVR